MVLDPTIVFMVFLIRPKNPGDEDFVDNEEVEEDGEEEEDGVEETGTLMDDGFLFILSSEGFTNDPDEALFFTVLDSALLCLGKQRCPDKKNKQRALDNSPFPGCK